MCIEACLYVTRGCVAITAALLHSLDRIGLAEGFTPTGHRISTQVQGKVQTPTRVVEGLLQACACVEPLLALSWLEAD